MEYTGIKDEYRRKGQNLRKRRGGLKGGVTENGTTFLHVGWVYKMYKGYNGM